MSKTSKHGQRFLEAFFILIAVALSCMLYKTAGYKIVVLNLYFFPVVLAGFFLGRYRAGILALFCVISASVATALDWMGFAASNSPIVIGLAISVWGAVLGITSILVGTLSDERSTKIQELHEAYVGVVEVLSRYLQSANPKLKARSYRVAELSQAVAEQMKLSSKEVDDIRVAALLHDMGNVEVTTKVICKAMGSLEEDPGNLNQHTFHGTDLVHSLGSVLTGAMPLLVNQSDAMQPCPVDEKHSESSHVPVGAKIIGTIRAYDALTDGEFGEPCVCPQDAIDELARDEMADHEPAILESIQRAISRRGPAPQTEAVYEDELQLTS